MRIRTRATAALAIVAIGLVMVAGSASAYDFPSTNDADRAAGLPHVNQVATGPGTVTLEFVNETNSLAFFEYRIDGVTVGTTAHPVVIGDVIHPGVCVDGRTPPACTAGPIVRTFSPRSGPSRCAWRSAVSATGTSTGRRSRSVSRSRRPTASGAAGRTTGSGTRVSASGT